jgi:hypothetical protein
MPDNVFIQLPVVIQDLYLSVRDLPVGPASNPKPSSITPTQSEIQESSAVTRT